MVHTNFWALPGNGPSRPSLMLPDRRNQFQGTSRGKPDGPGLFRWQIGTDTLKLLFQKELPACHRKGFLAQWHREGAEPFPTKKVIRP
jgi:hypothetical protein